MLDREDFEARVFSYYLPLQRVREFVDRNLSEPIPLRAAARAAGLEEKYFSAFFHRKTGVCFRDWLAGRRVERAIEILKQRDDTITSVAATVGFQDLRTFERAFKRLTGLTPRELKRSVAPEILAIADSGGGLDDPLDRLHILTPWLHASPPESRSRSDRARA
jgi:AraC-like DNA-binding protein